MKKFNSFTLLVFSVALGSFVFLNSSSNGRGSEDRTGAPGSSGTCASCHGGVNNLNGNLTIELLDKNTQTKVTEYLPGTTYTVSIKATGTSTKMGFQSTILNSANQNIGSISNPSAGSAVYTTGRNIAGHTTPSSTGTWTYDWTSPTTADGIATIYGVSVISNKNNNDNGDQVVKTSISVSPAPSNSLMDKSIHRIAFYPNPTRGIGCFSQPVDQLQITDFQGKTVFSYDTPVQQISLDFLKPGIYFFSFLSHSEKQTTKIILQ